MNICRYFSFQPHSNEVTFAEAQKQCNSEGGFLANLADLQTFKALRVARGDRVDDCFLNLHTFDENIHLIGVAIYIFEIKLAAYLLLASIL